MKMPELADIEQLPVAQARAGELAAWDIMGAQPLHYRRTDDAKFLLYSVGWNETDNGGLPGSIADVNKGDWVWKN